MADHTASDPQPADAATSDATAAPSGQMVQAASPEAAVDAALATISAPPCAGACSESKRVSLATAGELRVVDAPVYDGDPTHVYLIVIGAGARWWATATPVRTFFGCGLGHCNERALEDITVKHLRDRVRITFTMRDEYTSHVDGATPRSATIDDVVVECEVAAIPRCTDGSAP